MREGGAQKKEAPFFREDLKAPARKAEKSFALFQEAQLVETLVDQGSDIIDLILNLAVWR